MALSDRHTGEGGAGAATARGAILVVVAVVLGLLLLNANDGPSAGDFLSADDLPGVATTVDPGDDGTGGDGGAPGGDDGTQAPTTTVALRPAAQVKVLAANGTSTRGLARTVKDALQEAGYNALSPTDAAKKPVATSAVYFREGFEAEARVVAELLRIGVANVQPLPAEPLVANLLGADVLVVAGQDRVQTVATTTTARRATTTTAPG